MSKSTQGFRKNSDLTSFLQNGKEDIKTPASNNLKRQNRHFRFENNSSTNVR